MQGTFKKLLLIMLIMTVALFTFACGEKPCSHKDGDGDGICDSCKSKIEANVPEDLLLIDEGYPTFQFVLTSDSISYSVIQSVDGIIRELKKQDIIVNRVRENQIDKIQEIEVLIGDVKNRGDEYTFDKYSLGSTGYTVKLVGTKVIINAVTEENLLLAISRFKDEILGLVSDAEPISDVIMTASQSISVVRDDYQIESIAIAGKDLAGYTLAVDTFNSAHVQIATELQAKLYDKAGYYLKIVDMNAATDKSIVIRKVAASAVPGGFKISANSGGRLLVECAYENALEDNLWDFLNEKIFDKTGKITIPSGTLKTKDVSIVYYEDFGAKGDGETDDFKAIYDAHVYANAGGQVVRALAGRTYLLRNSRIDGVAVTIPIKTNVVWTDASFIIDDTDISIFDDVDMYGKWVFTVLPNSDPILIKDADKLAKIIEDGIGRGTAQIDLGFSQPAMIITNNSSHKVYRRRGYGSFDGQPMQEVILLKKDGIVDESTPIIFDYNNMSYIRVYHLGDLEPITIEGGTFTTRATRVNCILNGVLNQNFFNRGLNVERSFTTVRGVKHYVEGEFTLAEQNAGMVGAPYHGFFSAHNATNVTFEDCIYTARRCYSRSGGTTGTYAHSAWDVSNLTYKNCHLSNFWVKVDPDTLEITAVPEGTEGAMSSMTLYYRQPGVLDRMYWGSGGTNFCKNVVFDNSSFSRFDAHSGMWGGKIINGSVFNTISLTGGGEMEISNSVWYAPSGYDFFNALAALRSDFGSTWDGVIKIKNLSAYVYDDQSHADVAIISHTYTNWYYGETCHFPSVEIDNLDLYDVVTGEPMAPGAQVQLVLNSSIGNTKMHLAESHTSPYFSVEDRDGDGYVDYPYDHDGDGVIGNTEFKYEDYEGISSGILDTSSKLNLNPICPPEFIKILGNDGVDTDGDGIGEGGYTFVVPKTDGYGISSGGYHGVAENMGGFFGSTKFYYTDIQTGEIKHFLGTGATDASDSPFVFVK